MATFLVILRVIHIFSGMYWAGAALTAAVFVIPSAKAIGPEGGKFLRHLRGPGRFNLSLYVSSLAATISGVLLYGLIHGFRLGMLQFPFGLSITVGSVAGVVAVVHGVAVQGRSASQITRLVKESQRSGQPLTAEQLAQIQALDAKLTKGGHLGVAILIVTVIAMAVARYL